MRKVGTGVMFAFGLGVALAAQSTSQSTTPSDPVGTAGQSTTAQSRAGAAGQSMTVVGCLQRGGAGAAATTGTTGAAGGATASASTGSGFILTNAMRGGTTTTTGATSAAGGTTSGAPTGVGSTSSSSSGVTAADGSGQVAPTYMLEGNASDLTPHVGHRVEITGTMMRGAGASSTTGGTTSGAGATSGAGTASAAGARAMAPRLDVTAVRMISADCGSAGR